MKYSIIIPCYKSGSISKKVIDEVIESLGDDYNYNFILIDDFSQDNTWSELLKIFNEYSHMKIIKHSKNMGESFSILTGLKHCNGDYAITLDDDLRHPPKYLKQLISKMDCDTDIVYGAYVDQFYGGFRSFCSVVNNKIANIVLQKKDKVNISGFKIIRRPLIERLKLYNSKFIQMDGLIYSNTKKVNSINIICNENNSRYNLRRLYIQLSSMVASSPRGSEVLIFLILILLTLIILINSLDLFFLSLVMFFLSTLCFLLIIPVLWMKINILLNKQVEHISQIKTSSDY